MKSLILILSLYSHEAPQSIADTTPLINKMYKTTLASTNKGLDFGYLVYLDDTTIGLANNFYRSNAASLNNGISKHAYYNVEQVKFTRKGSVGRGVAFGTLIGFGTGALIGLMDGNDPVTPYTGNPVGDFFVSVDNAFAMTAGEKAVLIGITTAISGALIGAIIGAVSKKKFNINRQKDRFDTMRNRMMNSSPKRYYENQY